MHRTRIWIIECVVGIALGLVAAVPLAAQAGSRTDFSIGARKLVEDPFAYRRGLWLAGEANDSSRSADLMTSIRAKLRSLAGTPSSRVTDQRKVECPMPVQSTSPVTAPMPVSRADPARLEPMPVGEPGCTNPLFTKR